MNFAKQQLGTKTNKKKRKILGILWDKQTDSFLIGIPNFSKRLTEKNILQILASIYDPLGFISPCFLSGKGIYRNVCDLKISWDEDIPRENQDQWLKWIRDLHDKITFPRSIPIKRKQIFYIDFLHYIC